MDDADRVPSGPVAPGDLAEKLVTFLDVILKKVDATGDVNASMLYLVAQLGKTFSRKLRDEDPVKLRAGILWLNTAMTMIANPSVTTEDFERWASS